jgi:hypothetical protein
VKLIKTKITEHEARVYDEIVKETTRTKYFLGIKISKETTRTKTPIPPITSIKRKNHRFGEIELEVGMRVINRSNEPDDLMVCEIIGFDDCGGKVAGGGGAFPLIRDEKTGEEYMTMGVVLPYTDELMSELEDLRPIEQWNYLVYPHAQIKEKYGIKYRTFK